jgi:hypothetical protein
MPVALVLTVLLASGPWQGTWETTYGTVVMTQDGSAVSGFYDMGGPAAIEGTVRPDGRLVFTYTEPSAAGEGWFELSSDSLSFSGMWREEGSTGWTAWEGARTASGLQQARWLVVLEVEWQTSMAEPEFSFGRMLETFFARVAGVEVRHRYFHGLSDLRRFCTEAAALPGDVYLIIACHATEEGLGTPSGTLAAADAASALECFDERLRLVHMSACLVMDGDYPKVLLRSLEHRPVVSGYTESVDWAESAALEMLYLSLVLERGEEPADAAEAIQRMVHAAGPPGGPLSKTGFTWAD